MSEVANLVPPATPGTYPLRNMGQVPFDAAVAALYAFFEADHDFRETFRAALQADMNTIAATALTGEVLSGDLTPYNGMVLGIADGAPFFYPGRFIGEEVPALPDGYTANDAEILSGYSLTDTEANAVAKSFPALGGSGTRVWLLHTDGLAGRLLQTATELTGNVIWPRRSFTRSYNGVSWSSWTEQPFLINSGTGGNGYYEKWSDGRLVCRHRVTAAYGGSGLSLSVTWSFPIAPVGTVYLTALNKVGSSLSGGPGDLSVGLPYATGVFPSAPSISIVVPRQSGEANFVSGNTVSLDVEMRGRWA
ncbi:hypothetical protein [Pseudoroseicyclus sp. CXY001]|uniref:hypothetical protein n=1 Tax=Pseudoroseicyclus sp. CXY001 TaxID=3242492 RepID=UPI003570F373